MSTLERRYRRLLRWYPKEHRRDHEEEMLAILLAADPARPRPSWGDRHDLVLGALRIRARRLRDAVGPGWCDALAVMSLAGPLLMLGAAVSGFMFVAAGGGSYTIGSLEVANVATVAWVLVLVAALAGSRWTAAVLGAALTVLSLAQVPEQGSRQMTVDAALILTGLVTTVALAGSAGPQRGAQILGRRGTVCAVVAGLLMAAVNAVIGREQIISDNGWMIFHAVSAVPFLLLAPMARRCRPLWVLLGPPFAALAASFATDKLAWLSPDLELYPYDAAVPYAVAAVVFALLWWRVQRSATSDPQVSPAYGHTVAFLRSQVSRGLPPGEERR